MDGPFLEANGPYVAVALPGGPNRRNVLSWCVVQEGQYRGQDGFGIAKPRQVGATRKGQERRVGQVSGQVSTDVEGDCVVALPVDHQRRASDVRCGPPGIQGKAQPQEFGRRLGRGRSQLVAAEGARILAGQIRGEQPTDGCGAHAPVGLDQAHQGIADVVGPQVRAARVGPDEHDLPNAPGVGGGPGEGHGSGAGEGQHIDAALGETGHDGVEDLDFGLLGELLSVTAAEADARTVVADDRSVLREGREEIAESRLLPVPFQVRDPPRRAHQQRTRPVGGVRDSGAICQPAKANDGVSHGSLQSAGLPTSLPPRRVITAFQARCSSTRTSSTCSATL